MSFISKLFCLGRSRYNGDHGLSSYSHHKSPNGSRNGNEIAEGKHEGRNSRRKKRHNSRPEVKMMIIIECGHESNTQCMNITVGENSTKAPAALEHGEEKTKRHCSRVSFNATIRVKCGHCMDLTVVENGTMSLPVARALELSS
jgi:hypothetical protein